MEYRIFSAVSRLTSGGAGGEQELISFFWWLKSSSVRTFSLANDRSLSRPLDCPPPLPHLTNKMMRARCLWKKIESLNRSDHVLPSAYFRRIYLLHIEVSVSFRTDVLDRKKCGSPPLSFECPRFSAVAAGLDMRDAFCTEGDHKRAVTWKYSGIMGMLICGEILTAVGASLFVYIDPKMPAILSLVASIFALLMSTRANMTEVKDRKLHLCPAAKEVHRTDGGRCVSLCVYADIFCSSGVPTCDAGIEVVDSIGHL